MRNQFYFLFIISFFYLGIITNANPQSLTQNDSIINKKTEQNFYRVYFDKDSLSNNEKTKLLSKYDSIFQALGNWEYSIASKQVVCLIFQQERAYDKLDLWSKEIMNIIRFHVKKDNALYGRALNFRAAAIYENKKDFGTAIPLIKETIDLYKKNNKSLLRLSIIYINLGICYQSKGDYDLAIEQFQKSLKIQFDSLQFNGPETPSSFNQLGICYSKKNQFDEASKAFKDGLEYAKKAKPKRRQVDQVILYLYQNLAELYLKDNQLEKAKKYITLALNFQKDQNYLKDAFSFQLQGDYFLAKKEFDASLKSYQNSKEAAKQEFKNFKRHPDIGTTYFKIGKIKFHQNDLDAALYNYQLALVNNSLTFDSKDPIDNPSINDLITPLQTIDILQAKAEIFSHRFHKKNGEIDDLKKAFTNYSFAIEVITKTKQSFNVEGSKYNLAEQIIPIYESAIETAFHLYQVTKEQKWLESGFRFAEQNKATALLDAIQNNEALTTSGIPDSLLKKEYESSVEIAFYKKLIHEASQQEGPKKLERTKSLKHKLLTLKEKHQNLIDYFEKHYPDYHALKFRLDKIDINRIQNTLSNTGLVEFFVGQKNIFVFTITSDRISCQQITKENRFENDVKDLIQIINSPPDSKTINKSLNEFKLASARLYNLLLKQTINKLPASINHINIIPDDILAYLPFSTLINPKKNSNQTSFNKLDYLFHKYQISYNYSAALSLKKTENNQSKALKKFIGFAPEFTSYKNDNKLSPLSCNITEVDQIKNLLNTGDFIKEEDAKIQHFKENASDYQIIHLATHTDLDNQNSSFNKIYFSDDYLSQNDLYQLKLRASLAVLSACNTGIGELKKGEGVMSLSRGFTQAGCPSILMSLWSVDDCATADIMLYYYQNLKDGATKEVALKNAKEKYLAQTSDILQAHPYYWAGFVQYGDVSPISFTSFPWNLLLVGLALILGLTFFFRIKK